MGLKSDINFSALKSHPTDFYNEQKTQLEATLVILTHDNNVHNFLNTKIQFIKNKNIKIQKIQIQKYNKDAKVQVQIQNLYLPFKYKNTLQMANTKIQPLICGISKN